jgi:hypothetical protein
MFFFNIVGAFSLNHDELKLLAVELRGIFSAEYRHPPESPLEGGLRGVSLATPAAALYAQVKDTAATALAKHFQ